MRRSWLMVLLGLAAAVGCGGSRQEVRLSSSVEGQPIQQRIDGLAAGFVNNLLGGTQ